MPIYELAALGAAICWALTGLISAGPAGHLGAFTFNQMRQIFVSFLLMIYVVATGTWHQLSFATAIPLFLSGVIGIFLGDTMLFATLNRLGPRRAGILFAMNAPIAAFLGWGVLGEELTLRLVAGITLTIVGVCFAIFFNSRRVITHALETVHGSWTVGNIIGSSGCDGSGSWINHRTTGDGKWHRSISRLTAACWHGGLLPQCSLRVSAVSCSTAQPYDDPRGIHDCTVGYSRAGHGYDADAVRSLRWRDRYSFNNFSNNASHYSSNVMAADRSEAKYGSLAWRNICCGGTCIDLVSLKGDTRDQSQPNHHRRVFSALSPSFTLLEGLWTDGVPATRPVRPAFSKLIGSLREFATRQGRPLSIRVISQ